MPYRYLSSKKDKLYLNFQRKNKIFLFGRVDQKDERKGINRPTCVVRRQRPKGFLLSPCLFPIQGIHRIIFFNSRWWQADFREYILYIPYGKRGEKNIKPATRRKKGKILIKNPSILMYSASGNDIESIVNHARPAFCLIPMATHPFQSGLANKCWQPKYISGTERTQPDAK